MTVSADQCVIIWKSALDLLESQISDKYVFETFFLNNTHLHRLEGDEAMITVKSRLSKVVIETKFMDRIKAALHDVTETYFRCVIKEQSEIDGLEGPNVKIPEAVSTVFTTNLNPSFTFENFVVGNCNREAHNASVAVATEPGKFFTPLFIYGKSGTGKTHLLNASGNYIRFTSPHAVRVLYVETRDFIDDFIKSAKNRDFEQLGKKYESIDVLLIDDIQFLVGSAGTSEFFFNVFNKLINANKQIVLTSDRRPIDLHGLEERLVSRFTQGLSVNIDAPQFETALSILKKKIEIHKLSTQDFSEEVLELIASRFASDVRQLEGALNRLIFYSINNNDHKIIDIEVASSALDPIRPNTGTDLTIARIIETVADYYSLSVEQITSKIRTSRLAIARHIAMYLCRELIKDAALVRIGQEFGGRDHTTVINACERIAQLLKTDPDYRVVIKILKQNLQK